MRPKYGKFSERSGPSSESRLWARSEEQSHPGDLHRVRVSGTSEGTGEQEPHVRSRVSVPRTCPGTCPGPRAPSHAGLVTRHMEITGL